MMQDLREKTKIVMIVVALAFVGLMVFEWGMDISGQSAAVQTGELGRVNGDPVSSQAYAAAYQQLYDRARQQVGGELSAEQVRELEEAAFNQVVNELLLQQELRRRDIGVSDNEIRQAALWSPHPDLMGNELFQTNGQFDIQKWQQFLASPSANDQLLQQLEQYYRQVLPREKLMRQVTAGTWLSDAELWQIWRDRNETATVDYVALDLSKLAPGDVTVSEQEIKQYYDANREKLKRPATGRFSFAVLSKAPTAADTAASLQRAAALRQQIQAGADFAEVARRESADPGSKQQGGSLGTFGRGQMTPVFEQAAFSLPVGEISEPLLTPFGIHLLQVQSRTGDQVTARHILIPVEPSEEALDRLYARADSLEDLAARVGLQRAARATGATVRTGVLVSENQTFVPGIGSGLEALNWARDEAGQDEAQTISPLFETQEAFYVASREAFFPAGITPLKDASAQIRRELILKKRRDKARQVGQQIVAEARQGKTLEQAAQERGLAVESFGPFSRLMSNPVFGQATSAVGAAFGTPIGKVSDVAETTAGLFIVRPTARTEADRKEFEAQKSQFRNLAMMQVQQQQVSQFLESLRKQAKIVDRRAEARQQQTQAS